MKLELIYRGCFYFIGMIVFWVVLACKSLHVCTVCVSGAVNKQGFVWKFPCAAYEFSFIHTLENTDA